MEEEKTDKSFSQEREVSQIYTKYNAPLRGFISKRVRISEDVEDILQNVFYSLSKIDLTESPIRDISGWLYSVARNQIIDRSRKKKETPLYQTRSDDGDTLVFLEEVTEALSDMNSPEVEYIRSLVWEELDVALQELPEEQRAVFELSELDGFSFKEISEATGIGINTLLSRKRYAVLHLRNRLIEIYEDVFLD